MIVADTSLIANLLIPSLRSPEAERVAVLDPEWVAPPLWRSEFISTLLKYVRSGAFTVVDAQHCLREAERMIREDVPISHEAALGVAVSSGASSYDCEFVIAGTLLGIRVVSADRRLAARFPGTVVLLSDFAAN